MSLSSNDSIQTATAKSNKISLLIELADHYSMVFDILWALSFNSVIVQQLQLDRAFLVKLVQINHQTDDENLQKVVNGLLWNLHSDRGENMLLSKTSEEKSFDIMISYCHKETEICRKLYEELVRSGYRVWIDFDQMHGNVMDAMAHAIEQSRTMIICMSEQYRRSNYCRAEAQYAFQKQLNIVPILVQMHYKPDGWLSFLIGPLLYVNFTKYEYSKALEMLMKELKNVPKTSIAPIEPKLKAVDSLPRTFGLIQPTDQFMTLPENIHDWSDIHVHHWLTKSNLPQMARILSNMDGPSLIYFREYMINNEPQRTVASLQQDALRLTNETVSLVQVARFRSLIEQESFTRFIPIKQMNKKNSKPNHSSCCSLM